MQLLTGFSHARQPSLSLRLFQQSRRQNRPTPASRSTNQVILSGRTEPASRLSASISRLAIRPIPAQLPDDFDTIPRLPLPGRRVP